MKLKLGVRLKTEGHLWIKICSLPFEKWTWKNSGTAYHLIDMFNSLSLEWYAALYLPVVNSLHISSFEYYEQVMIWTVFIWKLKIFSELSALMEYINKNWTVGNSVVKFDCAFTKGMAPWWRMKNNLVMCLHVISVSRTEICLQCVHKPLNKTDLCLSFLLFF